MAAKLPTCESCGYPMGYDSSAGEFTCYTCKRLITKVEPTLKSLGSSNTEYQYDTADKKLLERFDTPFSTPHSEYKNPNLQSKQNYVSLSCFEFTSLCPITGQPDWGTIEITYRPDKYCVESKSLKLYLMSYRQHGAFHESCVNQIACDLYELLKPLYLSVKGKFNGRGGIAINPECTIQRD